MLRKPAFSVRYLLVMILIFIFLSTFKDISHKTSDELIVFNNSGNITLSIRTGKKLNLYEGEKDISPDILKFCATRGLKLIKKGKPKDPSCLKVNDNKILVSSSPGLTNLSKLDPDVIIITGAYPSTAKVISHPGKVKAIIISPEVRSGTRLTEITKPIASDTVHIVRQYGAFRMRL